MARTIFSIFLGTLIAGLVVTAFGYGFTELYRLPDANDFASQESLLDYAAGTPRAAIACMLAAWAVAALIGGWVAAISAGPRQGAAALVVGALLTATVIVHASLIPNPEWVAVTGMLLPIPFAVLAGLLAMPRLTSPTLA
ncbi:MAG: hypothetical protein ABIO17_09050 [Pseudoxanthomonas sp.]